jgi:hypothetical protein
MKNYPLDHEPATFSIKKIISTSWLKSLLLILAIIVITFVGMSFAVAEDKSLMSMENLVPAEKLMTTEKCRK